MKTDVAKFVEQFMGQKLQPYQRSVLAAVQRGERFVPFPRLMVAPPPRRAMSIGVDFATKPERTIWMILDDPYAPGTSAVTLSIKGLHLSRASSAAK